MKQSIYVWQVVSPVMKVQSSANGSHKNLAEGLQLTRYINSKGVDGEVVIVFLVEVPPANACRLS